MPQGEPDAEGIILKDDNPALMLNIWPGSTGGFTSNRVTFCNVVYI